MSRGLTNAQVEALQLESTIVKVIINIQDIVGLTTYRYCSGSLPIVYKNNVYSPRALRVSASSSGKVRVNKTTIEFDNRDDAFSTTIAGDGITGAVANVILLTTIDGVPGDPIVLASGVIDRCSINEDIKIEISPKNKGVKAEGLLRGSRTCPYIHTGLLCQDISGDSDCNRTLTDCNGTDADSTKDNAIHFGGFIWALDAGESIMVEGAPVQVKEHTASGGTDEECHSGRFVTLLFEDGHTERVELRCDIEPRHQNHETETDGYTEPWQFHIDYNPAPNS